MEYRPNFLLTPDVRLCGVVCHDGVELMGVMSSGLANGDAPRVLLYLPGQFDNAYQQRKNHALLTAAVGVGVQCVLANTRGQDYYGYQRSYPPQSDSDDYTWQLLGSTFERVAEASYDIAAWLDLIASRVPDVKVTLVGHSHGAIKIANYLANGGQDAASVQVTQVALLSPSDDIAAQREKLGPKYDEALTLADALVNEGKADTLMPDWAFGAPMSAGTYCEAYSTKSSPLRIFALADPASSPLSHPDVGWHLPTLVVYGEHDAATAGLSSHEAVRVAAQLLSTVSRYDSFIVPGANHHYRGAEHLVAETVMRWMMSISSPSS